MFTVVFWRGKKQKKQCKCHTVEEMFQAISKAYWYPKSIYDFYMYGLDRIYEFDEDYVIEGDEDYVTLWVASKNWLWPGDTTEEEEFNE